MMKIKLSLYFFLFCFIPCTTLQGTNMGFVTQCINEPAVTMYYVCEAMSFPIKCVITVTLAKYLLDELLTTLISYKIESDFWLKCLYYIGARVDAQLLRSACKDNDEPLILRCLQYGSNPNKAVFSRSVLAKLYGPDRFHYSNALHIACYHGNETIIRALIAKGARVNDLDRNGESALDFAESDEIIKLLINHGALYFHITSQKKDPLITKIFCHDKRKEEYYTNPGVLGNVLSKLQKDMQVNEEIKMIVKRICRKEINYTPFGVNFFALEGNDVWIRQLYDMLYRCIADDNERNTLLLKLFMYNYENKQKFDQSTFAAAIVHDDLQFIEKIIKQVEGRYLSTSRQTQTYLRCACKHNSKNVVNYIYQNHDVWLIGKKRVIWHTVASTSKECLQHLLKSSQNPFRELRRENELKQTVFYVAVTNNTIEKLEEFDFFDTPQTIPFLEEQLDGAVDINESSKIRAFVTFCVKNGADVTRKKEDDLCTVKKAKQRLLAHAESLENDVQVCFGICDAFKSVLSAENKKIYFPNATS